MTILYDLSATQSSGSDGLFHGGGEYAKVVFYRLCELLPTGVSVDVFFNPKKNIDNYILDICKKREVTINHCYSHADINDLLKSKTYDVFYSALPYSFYNLIIPPKTKFVYTIHGLRHLEYPMDKYMLKYGRMKFHKYVKYILFSFFPFLSKKMKSRRDIDRLNKLFSLTKNQTIITISNHSKYAIFYFFHNVDISKLKVLYSPLKEYRLGTNDVEILRSFSLEHKKYFLLICGHRSEKGAYRACRVLHKILMEHNKIPDDIKVIVLGVSHYKPYRKLTNGSSKFKFHGYVSTENLEILYKNAHLFLYPTLNEGFGYPPLEAMKYGTICACSANSAITEIYGDSVLYFNPYDETEMSIRILQSFDERIRSEKSKKIPDRYKQITERQKQDLDILIQNIISK